MNILHVLSQFEVTGAEAYATSLIEEQVNLGHTVFVASDTLTLPAKATYLPTPIGRRSYRQRIRNVLSLVRLIQEKNITIVHAHSRAASWVSYFAARLTKRPLVSSVHGRQHIHASSRAFNIYGRHIIAIAETVKSHLVNDLGIRAEHVTIIPNCIPFERWEASVGCASNCAPSRAGEDPWLILFIGRLTGPKGDVARFLLKHVLPPVLQHHRATFTVIGGLITPPDIPELISSLNRAAGRPVVSLEGFRAEIAHIAQRIVSSDVVIASGRLVPETMALRRPVIAFGESNYVGVVSAETFDEAASTNFGDTGRPDEAEPNIVAYDLIRILEHPPTRPELERASLLARRRFDSKSVAAQIQAIYEKSYIQMHSPTTIPVLMYHRVVTCPPAGSAHGIWVGVKDFEAQLRSLHARSFETITFRDHEEFACGRRALPRRPIILTFDDGYEDNYTVAFPLLRQYGYRAVIFAVTDSERRTNSWDPEEPEARLLSFQQLRELSRYGIEIGSHTVSHINLVRADLEVVRKELRESKATLEQIVGLPVLSFAYPYGALDARTKELVAEAGYKFAAAAESGPLRLADDVREIRRTQIFPWTTRFGFWKKTLPSYQLYKQFKASVAAMRK